MYGHSLYCQTPFHAKLLSVILTQDFLLVLHEIYRDTFCRLSFPYSSLNLPSAFCIRKNLFAVCEYLLWILNAVDPHSVIMICPQGCESLTLTWHRRQKTASFDGDSNGLKRCDLRFNLSVRGVCPVYARKGDTEWVFPRPDVSSCPSPGETISFLAGRM